MTSRRRPERWEDGKWFKAPRQSREGRRPRPPPTRTPASPSDWSHSTLNCPAAAMIDFEVAAKLGNATAPGALKVLLDESPELATLPRERLAQEDWWLKLRPTAEEEAEIRRLGGRFDRAVKRFYVPLRNGNRVLSPMASGRLAVARTVRGEGRSLPARRVVGRRPQDMVRPPSAQGSRGLPGMAAIAEFRTRGVSNSRVVLKLQHRAARGTEEVGTMRDPLRSFQPLQKPSPQGIFHLASECNYGLNRRTLALRACRTDRSRAS